MAGGIFKETLIYSLLFKGEVRVGMGCCDQVIDCMKAFLTHFPSIPLMKPLSERLLIRPALSVSPFVLSRELVERSKHCSHEPSTVRQAHGSGRTGIAFIPCRINKRPKYGHQVAAYPSLPFEGGGVAALRKNQCLLNRVNLAQAAFNRVWIAAAVVHGFQPALACVRPGLCRRFESA